MSQFNTDPNVIALHRLRIASPCTASWDRMTGDDRVRHCGGCNKNVFNLSAMPEAEAAALLAQQPANGLCVRFYRRADGTVMTSDCGAPSAARRPLPVLATAAALAMSLTACAPSATTPDDIMKGSPPQVDSSVDHGRAPAARPLYIMGEVPVPVVANPEPAAGGAAGQ